MENFRANYSLINELPDDCLAHVFSYLPILERLLVENVCKRWRTVCEKGWNDIKELKIDRSYTDCIIYSILERCGRYLKKLSLFDSPQQFNSVSVILKFCRLDQLEDIEIFFAYDFNEERVELNIGNLGEIFEKTKKLGALTISGNLDLYGTDYLNFLNPRILQKLDLSNTSFKILPINPDRFPNLRELNLKSFKIIGDEMTRESESLKGLEKINITSCNIPQSFIRRIETFTNLQEFTLQNNFCDIRNDHIRQIAGHCPKINKITLAFSGSSSVTSDCFQYLGVMQLLEVLNFENCFHVNSRDIAHLTNVKKLFFFTCMDVISGDGLIELIANSPNLEELKLYNIRALSVPFLNDVRRIFHRGQREKRLHIEVVGGSSDERLGVARDLADHPLLDLSVCIRKRRKREMHRFFHLALE